MNTNVEIIFVLLPEKKNISECTGAAKLENVIILIFEFGMGTAWLKKKMTHKFNDLKILDIAG